MFKPLIAGMLLLKPKHFKFAAIVQTYFPIKFFLWEIPSEERKE